MTKSTYEITDQKTVKWPQVVAGLSAAGGAFAFGAALGWAAPAGPRLVAGDDRYFDIDQTRFDWAASVITIGCAISCLPIGILMKSFGRKWTMISLVAPFLIGWGLVIWAQNFVMLMVGRFFLGLAGGAFCVSAPQYSSEIAEKDIRGIVGTFFQLLINGGVLFVYVIGAFISVFWMSVVSGIVPIIFGLVFFFMPESPVYLVDKKRENDAVKTYKWLRGSGYDPQQEIDDLKFEFDERERNKVSFGEIMSRKATKRALFIGFGLMFFQQASGVNVVIFYATAIFEVSSPTVQVSPHSNEFS
jgi:MFS family permease